MHGSVVVLGVLAMLGGCGMLAQPAPGTVSAARQIDNPRAAFARAYDLYQRGQLQEALALFSALEMQYPALADYDLYFVGMIAARRGDQTAAEAAFQKLLETYPDSIKAAPAELELGRLRLRAGRIDAARAPLGRAAQATDSATALAARCALAEADAMSGSVAAAYSGYSAVRHDAPGSKWGREAKAKVLTLRAQYPDLAPLGAARVDELQLLVAERDWPAVELLARTLLAEGEGPERVEVLVAYAAALSGQGRIDEAVAALQQVAERYPRHSAAPDALFRAASLLWNRDRDAEALRLFEDFRNRYADDPRAPDAVYAIGRIHQAAGREQEALSAYAAVMQRYPGAKVAPEARWRIGWIHYQAAAWRPAAAAFAQLARETAGEQQAGALYWQARALARGGDAGGADGLYGAVIDVAPTGYYAMWAQQQRAASAAGLRPPSVRDAADQVAAPRETVDPGPFPGLNTFHSSRADELRRAGLPAMARAELARVERQYGGDPEVTRYLLRAYPGVDGYAAAIRLSQRLGNSAGLSTDALRRVQYPLAFWEPVQRSAAANDVDPLLIQAIMRQESRFDPGARSPADAIGLMQLLPSTAGRVAAAGGDSTVDRAVLTNPRLNVQLGVRHFRSLLDRFAGDPLKALAAYNGGEAAVERWQARSANLAPDEFVESITYRETRDYVKRVVANYRMYRLLYVPDRPAPIFTPVEDHPQPG
jgi:soluble lytic murein transglycosylase-like protein/TolA-binding protein